jgi:hypothetical protein
MMQQFPKLFKPEVTSQSLKDRAFELINTIAEADENPDRAALVEHYKIAAHLDAISPQELELVIEYGKEYKLLRELGEGKLCLTSSSLKYAVPFKKLSWTGKKEVQSSSYES